MSLRSVAVAILASALAACAPVPKPPPPRPAPPAVLPGSSIRAVLAHRSELALDDGQISRLEQLDRELARKQEALRSEAAPSRDGTERRPPGDGAPRGGARGGGGGRGGRKPPGAEAKAAKPLQQQLDDADTAAFLEAEALLRVEQRDPAREIAERHREQVYDQRERAGAR